MANTLQHAALRIEDERENQEEHDNYDEEDDSDDDDENKPRNIRQHSRAVDFWKHIFEEGWLPMMNNVTRAIPRDPYAGLLHVHHRIWHVSKVSFLIWKACLMALNVTYIITSFQYVWTHDNNYLLAGDNSIVLSEKGAVACVHSRSSPNGQECIHTNLHRFYQHKIITAIEILVVLPIGFASLLINVLFICGGSYFRQLPSNRPWFFFFAPSSILSWSTLQAFQFVHPARIYSVWCLNEKKFWRLLFFYSLFPPGDDELMNASSRQSGSSPEPWIHEDHVEKKKKHFCCKSVTNSIGICLHVTALLLCFQAALLKLSTIHFAAVINSLEWTFWEWILVIGFFNQLVTAINPNTVEFHRMLLFLFGGADGYWTRSKVIVAHEFLSLVAYKISYGKIADECPLGPLRFGPSATMWSFTAHDIQNLVCCPLREKRLDVGTELREKKLQEMWEPSHCEQFIHRLKEAYRSDAGLKDAQDIDEGSCKYVVKEEQKRLSEIRDSLCRRVHPSGLDNEVDHSVRLLIAAEIQNGIEDLDEIWKPTQAAEHHPTPCFDCMVNV